MPKPKPKTARPAGSPILLTEETYALLTRYRELRQEREPGLRLSARAAASIVLLPALEAEIAALEAQS